MIEIKVHQQLRAFLREQGEPYWLHHLTMARLVARAFRLGRSALVQAGSLSSYHGRYRLSYLMPALMWPDGVVIVASEPVRQQLLLADIPRLREWIPNPKPVQTGDRWCDETYRGVLITSPDAWLSDRLQDQQRFPEGVVTIIDGAESLEGWVAEQLTVSLQAWDWEDLMLAYPTKADTIRDIRIQLTRSIFQHPANPYDSYGLDADERSLLDHLYTQLQKTDHPCLPTAWQQFRQSMTSSQHHLWVAIARDQGQFTLQSSPVEVVSDLTPIWEQQPTVLVGGSVDLEASAPIYRQRIGLGDVTCLKFTPDRQNEMIQLYLPDHLPLPNTAQYQQALLEQVERLLISSSDGGGFTTLIIGDTPLKQQMGSRLAAEFGSRVQVERLGLTDHGVLVTGWDFWLHHRATFPTPNLLIIATLPLPSLEDPQVAARVEFYKRSRQDWFRLYLLPDALCQLQQAIAPVRGSQGLVALLDNRVNYRSYGKQVIAALSPMARVSYVDPSLFHPEDCSVH